MMKPKLEMIPLNCQEAPDGNAQKRGRIRSYIYKFGHRYGKIDINLPYDYEAFSYHCINQNIELWNLSQTREYFRVGNHIFGTTAVTNTAPSVTIFLGRRNIRVTATHTATVNYAFFVNSINNFSIFNSFNFLNLISV